MNSYYYTLYTTVEELLYYVQVFNIVQWLVASIPYSWALHLLTKFAQ